MRAAPTGSRRARAQSAASRALSAIGRSAPSAAPTSISRAGSAEPMRFRQPTTMTRKMARRRANHLGMSAIEAFAGPAVCCLRLLDWHVRRTLISLLARLDKPSGPAYKATIPRRFAPDAQVAQLVEHATENRSVGGSIPPLGTILSVNLSWNQILTWLDFDCPHSLSHTWRGLGWVSDSRRLTLAFPADIHISAGRPTRRWGRPRAGDQRRDRSSSGCRWSAGSLSQRLPQPSSHEPSICFAFSSCATSTARNSSRR